MTSSPPDPDPSSTPRSARFRLALLLVLVVVLLASAGTVVWLLAGRSGEADDLQSERDGVMAQARQFMLRSYTYGPDDLDDQGRLAENRAQVAEVVTDKFDTAYEESITAIEQLVKAQNVGQSAKVLGVGVQYLDDDSARALVSGESSFTQRAEDGTTQEVQAQTFRMVIDLVKQDGTWLVDASNVAADESAGTGSSPSSSPSPSSAPSPSGTAGGGR